MLTRPSGVRNVARACTKRHAALEELWLHLNEHPIWFPARLAVYTANPFVPRLSSGRPSSSKLETFPQTAIRL